LLCKLFDEHTNSNCNIHFDNQVTIIPIMCRGFDYDLEQDQDAQLTVRTRSSDADKVPSAAQDIDQLDHTAFSKMKNLNNDKKWIGVGTKVLLSNGLIGFVKNTNGTSVKFFIERFIPVLKLKGLTGSHNNKECAFTDNVKKSQSQPIENIWTVTVLEGNYPNIEIKTENIDVSLRKITENVHRETIVEILEDPSSPSYIPISQAKPTQTIQQQAKPTQTIQQQAPRRPLTEEEVREQAEKARLAKTRFKSYD
jgi:hypothetical protein